MAITRCPYCHAIIDENDKYCNNCGTQLLFPEDDGADEEIPGEKIIDAEVEEKDYTIDEPDEEKRPAAGADDDEDVDERLEEEMRDKAAETALDEIIAESAEDEEPEGATEEVILVDEPEDTGAPETAGTGEIEAKTGTGPTGDVAEEEEEEEEPEREDEDTGAFAIEHEAGREAPEAGPAEIKTEEEEPAEFVEAREAPDAAGGEPEVEYITETGAEDEAATGKRPSPQPVTFDTKDFDEIGRTVELGKDKIDEFLEELAGKTPATAPPPAAAEPPREPTGTLPPWASGMKGAPVFPPDTSPVDPKKAVREGVAAPDEEEEVEIFPGRRSPDSTLGLPERVGQSPLPFGGGAAEEEEGREEEAEDDTAETAAPPPGPGRPARPPVPPEREPASPRIESMEEYEEPEARGPFSFAVFFKSKAFDVLFVGLFWLVALWLAAHATDRTLFEVLGSVSGPMLLLYAVFVLLYFFLFKFFLGETLGDRLFRPRDQTPEN